MCVYIRVRVCTCARVCVCTCVCTCVYACVCSCGSCTGTLRTPLSRPPVLYVHLHRPRRGRLYPCHLCHLCPSCYRTHVSPVLLQSPSSLRYPALVVYPGRGSYVLPCEVLCVLRLVPCPSRVARPRGPSPRHGSGWTLSGSRRGGLTHGSVSTGGSRTRTAPTGDSVPRTPRMCSGTSVGPTAQSVDSFGAVSVPLKQSSRHSLKSLG